MENRKILDDKKYRGSIDKYYSELSVIAKKLNKYLNLSFRLITRFLAINYYYFTGIDWSDCSKNKIKVYFDLQYIFWFFHYYPENYYICRFWEKEKSEWIYYYGSIYDPLQRNAFRKLVHKAENLDIFRNKFTCYCYCKNWGLPVPETFMVFNPKTSGFGQLRDLMRKHPNKKFILKFNHGRGGSGILEPTTDEKSFYITHEGEKHDLDMVTINDDLIVQERITQHKEISKISGSVNTIRIITLLKPDNDVKIIGAYIRFGVGQSLVDNISSGGVGVKIDLENGKLEGRAFDRHAKTYGKHPTSNISFDGFELPYFTETLNLVIKAQKLFYFHKLIGFDIAITNNGPSIVEMNAEPDMIGLENKFGPILKQEDVFYAFKEYGLLINKFQRHLYDN